MKHHFALHQILFIALMVFMCASLSACGDTSAKVEPTAESIAQATAAPAWPDDEVISYCPAFTEVAPYKSEKLNTAQERVYTMKFRDIELETYQAYIDEISANENIVVDTNTNLRDNAFSFNAHKADDTYMMIHAVYTRGTAEMIVSVTYEHPTVKAE